MATDTIPNRLLQRAQKTPNDPAYYVREGGSWKPTNWATYSDEVIQAGRALILQAMNHPEVAKLMAWNAELNNELALMNGADQAWQTTMGASEILQELTLHQALAQADIGRLIRVRTEVLLADLDKLLGAAKSVRKRIPSATRGVRGLRVIKAACP